eukprot:TRINITY_DN2783_c0_g1_i3.p1 TRINITY_DN2783_c0_g1~~TRINITY_DN2783_c0_g1_i3.p1  ORF type:complete len:463 (-),score=74.56 TRINITY_DN2783_c0_g1_i3:114-1439(-)
MAPKRVMKRPAAAKQKMKRPAAAKQKMKRPAAAKQKMKGPAATKQKMKRPAATRHKKVTANKSIPASQKAKRSSVPSEPSHADAHKLVWDSIGGAMKASQLYLGDRLGLYQALRDLCASKDSSTTALQLADRCGLQVRWVREWCAQQASMGVLQLLDGEGDDDASLRYRLPEAFVDVFADKDSPHYDISLIQMVPALVNRARTSLPESFQSGLGIPYNDSDISMAIDRHHAVQIRDVVIPKVIPAASGGDVLKKLTAGVRVAELGCGGGNLMLAMAAKFPNSTFHGYEVSDESLALAASNIAESGLHNVKLHDARIEPLGGSKELFEVVTTFDVIHDAPNPAELIGQVKSALSSSGTWLLADIMSKDSVRSNVRHHPGASLMYAFSTCLCMSCALSTKDGAGLGTLGFTVPVAKKMLGAAGFSQVRVLDETANTRWFEVSH